MKLICISDTHREYIKPPEGDILIHAGDWSSRGEMHELIKFCNFIKRWKPKYSNIIVCPGNHDFIAEKDPGLTKSIIEEAGAIYLNDTACEIQNIKFYGSGYTPVFFNWAFNLPRGEPLRQKWALIPEDTNVLITHGPPLGIGDYVQMWGSPNQGMNVGCKDLLERINQLKDLKLHVFGHIHSGSGIYKQANKTFVNAAILDDNYKIKNEARIIDYETL